MKMVWSSETTGQNGCAARDSNPRIKSPPLRNSIPAIYQHPYASTLARYPQPAEAQYRLRTGATA
jgi:hypothetical protein